MITLVLVLLALVIAILFMISLNKGNESFKFFLFLLSMILTIYTASWIFQTEYYLVKKCIKNNIKLSEDYKNMIEIVVGDLKSNEYIEEEK